MSIAIGITTTLERAVVFQYCLSYWERYLPNNATIFIYCDYDLEGVSIAKNKVLAMCEYADDIFIVDDDIFPIVENWYIPYIESRLNHACYTFSRQLKEVHENYIEYVDPNGCMIYFKRICLDTIGGWDTDFKGYGYEHVNLSDRIFNAGLTPARYIDIPNSKGLFQMSDCESSFTSADRAQIPANYKLYHEKFYSKEFKPFK